MWLAIVAVLAGDAGALWALSQEPRSPAEVARVYTEALIEADCTTVRRLSAEPAQAFCEGLEPTPGVRVRAVRLVGRAGDRHTVEVDLDTQVGAATDRLELVRVAGRWRVVPLLPGG